MTLPSDPLEALKWAMNHSDTGWWVVGLVGAGIAWSSKRLREWSKRNSLSLGVKPAPVPPPAPPPSNVQPGSGATYAAAPSYAAAGYTAQPAYAAPAAAATSTHAQKRHREAAQAQRGVAPVARSVDVPVQTATGAWTLAGAFGDPSHARTAVVIAEVLGPPVGLR